MLRFLKKLILTLLVVVPLGLLVAVFLAYSRGPAVVGQGALTPALIHRAQALFRQHDPRNAREGQIRSVQLTGADVNLMANYAASRFGVATDMVLQDREAFVHASAPIPRSPFGGYVNVSAVIGESEGLPRVENVTVGRLPIPDLVADWVLHRALRQLSQPDGEQLAADTIKSVSIGEGLLRVEYEWRADLQDRLRALAVPREDVERLRAYHERIVRTLEDLPPQRKSIVDLLRPVMQLAGERSATGDPAAENRAAIIALTVYINGRGLAALVPAARGWPRATPRTLYLRGRDDLPKHFSSSAALAAAAGTPLSDAVGVYKEVNDSQGGSGFSFSDIAADRAGTTFGQLAMQSGITARRLQSRVSAGLTEADMMPEITGLADNMPEAEFTRRFGGVGAPAHARVIEDINRRVAGCPLFQ